MPLLPRSRRSDMPEVRARVVLRMCVAARLGIRSPCDNSAQEQVGGQKMRYVLIVLWMLLWPVTSVIAQVSVGIGLPGVSIGINLPLYPELVRVPGYPVYYAPRLQSNYFFYDGMYWVYERDNWYASSWYNGPWGPVAPEVVPLFVLRIPVRYYRQPPVYFRRWRADAAPRWGEHWGHEWEQRRSGWDRWNRSSAPAPAALPVYQRQYSGDRYPRVEQQRALHSQNYRYEPRDAVVRQHYQEHAAPQRGVQDQRQQAQQGEAQREQQTPRSSQENIPRGKGVSQEPRRGQGQEKDRERGEDRGHERNK